jgi:hypothetical protein
VRCARSPPRLRPRCDPSSQDICERVFANSVQAAVIELHHFRSTTEGLGRPVQNRRREAAPAGAGMHLDSSGSRKREDRPAARRPMAGTNDVLNNVRDFDSLRAAMPHSPGPHKYPRTRIPPARPYLSGHVVVAHMQNLFCTNWFIPRFDRGLLVQNHVQQGIMHFQCSSPGSFTRCNHRVTVG